MNTAAIEPASMSSATTGTMRAIVQRGYGADPATVLELSEIPRPVIGDGEVLVRVAAASVDMGTWHTA